MEKVLNKIILVFSLILPMAALAQEQKFSINMTQMSSGSLDLMVLGKLSAGVKITSVKILAKSSLGGAGVYLRVNDQIMSMASIDSDPANFLKDDGATYKSYELLNYQSSVTKAILTTPEVSNLNIKEVTIVLGQASSANILGNYPQLPAAVATANPNPSEKTAAIPSPGTLADTKSLTGSTLAQNAVDTPAVDSAPWVPQPTVTPPPPQCLYYGFRDYCVGQRVNMPWGLGTIVSVPVNRNPLLIVKMDNGQSYAINDSYMAYIK